MFLQFLSGSPVPHTLVLQLSEFSVAKSGIEITHALMLQLIKDVRRLENRFSSPLFQISFDV